MPFFGEIVSRWGVQPDPQNYTFTYVPPLRTKIASIIFRYHKLLGKINTIHSRGMQTIGKTNIHKNQVNMEQHIAKTVQIIEIRHYKRCAN